MFQKGKKQKSALLSNIGLGLSYLCIVHCISTPIFIAFLPVISAKVFNNDALEMFLLGFSFLAVGSINLIGFVKHHKKLAPLALMFLGFSLILSGHLVNAFSLEVLLSVLGGIALLCSILINNKIVDINASDSHSTCSH